ncbi:MAG: thioredoxin family protein [Pseudomonadales bacterium]
MSAKTNQKIRFIIRETIAVAAIFAVVFFGGKLVNSWLGQKALNETGIAFLDYDSAIQEAVAIGKPVLLEFGAVWCGACRKLNNQVMADERVREKINDNYIIAHVEWTNEEDRPIFQHFGVEAFPQVLILNADTGRYRRLPITFDPEQFLQLL